VWAYKAIGQPGKQVVFKGDACTLVLFVEALALFSDAFFRSTR
jgi:hypothetical protein